MIDTTLQPDEVDFVRNELTEGRWKHTRNVLDVAAQVATNYRVDEEPLLVAALFHDNARNLPGNEQRNLAGAFRGELDSTEGFAEGLWHAPAGAQRMIERFGYDPDHVSVQAVAFHTTATPNLTDCLKGLLVADFAEPGRGFPESDAVRNNIGEAPLEELVADVVREKLIRTLKTKRPIHERSVRTHNRLCD